MILYYKYMSISSKKFRTSSATHSASPSVRNDTGIQLCQLVLFLDVVQALISGCDVYMVIYLIF